MVKLGLQEECDCATCPGHVPIPKGYYGGYLCMCSCHDAQRAKEKAERELRDMCPFCHTNSDYQTSCCAKLANVSKRLITALRDWELYEEDTKRVVESIVKEIEC